MAIHDLKREDEIFTTDATERTEEGRTIILRALCGLGDEYFL